MRLNYKNANEDAILHLHLQCAIGIIARAHEADSVCEAMPPAPASFHAGCLGNLSVESPRACHRVIVRAQGMRGGD